MRQGQRNTFFQRVDHIGPICLPVLLPSDDQVGAAGQWSKFGWNRFPSFAAHQDRTTKGGAFEMRQVFWQVPRHLIVQTNDAIGGTRVNQFELH